MENIYPRTPRSKRGMKFVQKIGRCGFFTLLLQHHTTILIFCSFLSLSIFCVEASLLLSHTLFWETLAEEKKEKKRKEDNSLLAVDFQFSIPVLSSSAYQHAIFFCFFLHLFCCFKLSTEAIISFTCQLHLPQNDHHHHNHRSEPFCHPSLLLLPYLLQKRSHLWEETNWIRSKENVRLFPIFH